jgi:hypothetical protein
LARTSDGTQHDPSDAIEAVLRQVVLRHFPDEEIAFSASAPVFIADALAGRLEAVEKRGGEFGFAAELIAVLNFINVIRSTVNAVIELRRMARGPSPSVTTVREIWRARLVERGLAADKAESIVNEFSSELIDALKRAHAP